MHANATRQRAAALLLGMGGYLALVVGALSQAGRLDAETFSAVSQRWPREGGPVFASHFATWDAAHYLYLSDMGYAPGVASCAFYPAWPLLVRGLACSMGGNHLLAGFVLANCLSVAGFALFIQLAAKHFGVSAAKLATVFLLAFPGSLFYHFIYSEALFFLLLMLLWLGLERGRGCLAWPAAFMLPMTRAIGLFCLLPLLWHALRVAPPGPWARLVSRSPRLQWAGFGAVEGRLEDGLALFGSTGRREGMGAWGLLLAPALGWAAYVALMWHWTGNPFEGFEAQKHWATHSIGNLVNVPKFLLALANPTAWHAYAGSLLDRCVFVLLLYCLPLIWRLDRSRGLMIWTFVLGILPAMSGTFTSYTRFASCAFPMFLALGVFLAKPEHRHLRWALLTPFAVLHVVLLWRFVNFRWAG